MKNRITFLDGIRGLMAINVLLCHFVCVYFPSMYSTTNANLSEGAIFSYTPLSALVNGSVAVIYFFLLSGFLLSLSIFQKGSWNIKKILTKWCERYLRFFTYGSGSHHLYLFIDEIRLDASFGHIRKGKINRFSI